MKGHLFSRLPMVGGSSLAIGIAALVASAIAGCSQATAVKPSRLAALRTEAVASFHEADREFEVRWNPAQCDAPEFEVLLDGVWHRVFVDDLDDEESIPSMARDRLADDDGKDTLMVSGDLSSGLREAGNKTRYMVLDILDICPDTGCPPDED